MVKIEVRIGIGVMLEALGLSGLQIKDRKHEDMVKLEGLAEQDAINDLADEEEILSETITADPNDLRDGLNALQVGDRTMARTLLLRAFDGDLGARQVVEEVLR